MDNETFKSELGSHMITILNAVDGDGNRFEFGKTYHYFDYTDLRVKTFVAKYSCLALQPGLVSTKGDEAYYRHVKNQQDTEFVVPVRALHVTVKPAYEKALAHIPKVKQKSLDELHLTITNFLNRFQEQIDDFDEKQLKFQEEFKKIGKD